MKQLYFLWLSVLFALPVLAAGKKLFNVDIPELSLPINETIQIDTYAKKIGAFDGTDGFKATFWCTKLQKPKRVGAATTDIDCKWVAVE